MVCDPGAIIYRIVVSMRRANTSCAVNQAYHNLVIAKGRHGWCLWSSLCQSQCASRGQKGEVRARVLASRSDEAVRTSHTWRKAGSWGGEANHRIVTFIANHYCMIGTQTGTFPMLYSPTDLTSDLAWEQFYTVLFRTCLKARLFSVHTSRPIQV